MLCLTALPIRRSALARRREGFKQDDVVLFVRISQSLVHKIFRRLREVSYLRSRKSPRRPRMTTKRDSRRLLNLSSRNRKISRSRLRRVWRSQCGIRVSRQTVNRRLLQHGYRLKVVAAQWYITGGLFLKLYIIYLRL